MGDDNNPVRVLWVENLPRRPLCDVPWMGNTVVLSNGQVNFCCFSDAIVGNVNEHPLTEIWNGETMRRIRRDLRDQKLPPECESPSCPIFRGDENHAILTRMDGAYRQQLTRTVDPHADTRVGFAGSCLKAIRPTSTEMEAMVEFELCYEGRPVRADLYLAIRGEEPMVRFIPRLEGVPLPFRVGIRLPSDLPILVRWPGRGQQVDGLQPGSYEVCAAVFESGSHPNIASNCYWSTTATLRLGQVEQDTRQPVGGRVDESR